MLNILSGIDVASGLRNLWSPGFSGALAPFLFFVAGPILPDENPAVAINSDM
jgi:hypothetical protein